MAVYVGVTQVGNKIIVGASNTGPHAVLIDHVSLSLETPSGYHWGMFKYADGFKYGPRVATQSGLVLFEINYYGGPATARAVAHYIEFDQRAKGATVVS